MIHDYQWHYPTYTYQGQTKKVTTIREYDEQGRCVKETVTEETYTPVIPEPSPYIVTYTNKIG